MREIREEWVGVPKDVLPVLHRIIHNLNTLTLLEQQSVLEMLVTRHVLYRGAPERHKILDVLSGRPVEHCHHDKTLDGG